MEIHNHPFFDKIERGDLDALVEHTRVVTLNQGAIVFPEGAASECLYLLLEGTIGFFKSLPDDRKQVVSRCRGGSFFGEIGLFTGEPRSLGAIAETRSRVAEIPREVLVQYIRNTPGPVDKIIQSVVGHLHYTTRHYIDDLMKTEKLAVVGNMMNSIIHDFKNPFTLISLGAQVISQAHPDERTQKLCKNIEEQVRRMVDMANEISDFSRGQQNLNFSRVYLPELFNRFQELNAPSFQRRTVKVKMHAEPVALEAQQNKLIRVLQNLVTNAIESLPNGEGTVDVQGVKHGENEVRITVSDTGTGIPPEIRDRFFEPFVTSGKKTGTGLGTAIVKSIIEAHQGSISFKTATNEGTVFTIDLPITQKLAKPPAGA